MERVTSQQLLQFGQMQAQRHATKMGRAQVEVTSGIRIHRPSDDPRGQQIVLERRAALQQFNTRLTSLNDAKARLNTAHQAVRDAQQLIVHVKSLAMQARQATSEQETLALADEIDGRIQDLLRLANTMHEGRSLFAGAATQQSPFSMSTAGEILYQGSSIDGAIHLANYGTIKTEYSGMSVFGSVGGGSAAIVGSTGARLGTGTSSAAGPQSLTVTHTATTYSPGSGVQSGTGAAGNTIIGPAGTHTLDIDDTNGTVSLNGGEPVAFTNADTNLVVTGPDGEVVHLDMSAITPGYQGTVDLTATGTLSLDGGATTVPITFEANQAVINSQNGGVVFIDSQAIQRTGTDSIDLPGSDIFQQLSQLASDIRNTAGLSSAERDAALGRRIDELDQINDHLLSVIGEQSTTLATIDSLQLETENFALQAEETLSLTEGTDYARAVLQLQSSQMLLQYSLASTAKLFEISMLNFLS